MIGSRNGHGSLSVDRDISNRTGFCRLRCINNVACVKNQCKVFLRKSETVESIQGMEGRLKGDDSSLKVEFLKGIGLGRVARFSVNANQGRQR